MGWFGKKKVQYKDAVIEALNRAMAIRLKDEKVFENFPVNNLEAVIATTKGSSLDIMATGKLIFPHGTPTST